MMPSRIVRPRTYHFRRASATRPRGKVRSGEIEHRFLALFQPRGFLFEVFGHAQAGFQIDGLAVFSANSRYQAANSRNFCGSSIPPAPRASPFPIGEHRVWRRVPVSAE